MFKSIFSNIKSFGKKVVSKIVAFVGGTIGIQPQVIESAVPPQTEQVADNKTEEGFVKQALKATKKAFSKAIKVVFTFITGVLNFILDVLIIGLIFGSALGIGLAVAFGINYILIHAGVIALATALWETQGVAQIVLLALALIGVVNVAVGVAEVIWYLLLKHIHVFLWSIVLRDVSKLIPTEKQIVEAKAVNQKPTVTAVINEVEAPKKEPAMKIQIIETPITSSVEVDAVVDIRPTTTPIEEVKPEIVPVVPVVIEIEEASEVVDTIRPNTEKLKIDNPKELKAQLIEINEKEIDSILMSYRTSDLKKMIESLNKFIQDGLNKGNNRKDKKTALITEIKKQLKFLNKNVAVA